MQIVGWLLVAVLALRVGATNTSLDGFADDFGAKTGSSEESRSVEDLNRDGEGTGVNSDESTIL